MRSPVSSFQFPAPSFQFPAPSFQFPAPSFQFPASSFRFPAPRRQEPAGRLLLAVLLLALVPCLARAAEPLTVMTFNIRYGTANDGENHWTLRRGFLFDVVREQAADVIGLQEALDGQIREIVEAVPGYAVVGVGRDDGKTAGEYAAILFRKDRFNVAASGTFWFSETPEAVASSSWGNRITRICTWARLIDRDGSAFWVFNVHLDHQSQPSREKSAELLLRRIEARAFPGEPVVVTGDFNAGEDNAAIQTMVTGKVFVDTFRVIHPDEKRIVTFNGFKAEPIEGAKIDYVFVQPGTEVLSAEIVRTSRDGKFPSDHFPVVARVKLLAAAVK
jgi:endonuclease/exonuclease/phosphatase family metal-dependent hydrolase